MSQYASKDDMIGAMHTRIAELESELEGLGPVSVGQGSTPAGGAGAGGVAKQNAANLGRQHKTLEPLGAMHKGTGGGLLENAFAARLGL
jgi:hypothetical protein